jgi:hypothetical protein
MSLKEIIKVANFYNIKYKFAGEKPAVLLSFKTLLEKFGLDAFHEFKDDIYLFEKMESERSFEDFSKSGEVKDFSPEGMVQDWFDSCLKNNCITVEEHDKLTEKLNRLKDFKDFAKKYIL